MKDLDFNTTDPNALRTSLQILKEAGTGTENSVSDLIARVAALESEPKVQSGWIQMWGNATPPTGWLTCDGSAVSRSTYASLYAIVGTTFGIGDGSTTFNLPDFRGAAPAGVGTSTGYTQNETTVLAQKSNDSMQGHWHKVETTSNQRFAAGNASTGSGWPTRSDSSINANEDGVAWARTFNSDGSNGVPRVGSVTKGKTYGIHFIIKV